MGIEVERIRRGGRLVNSSNRELKIHGEDRALQRDLIPDLPSVFLGHVFVDDGARAVALPSCSLLRRNLIVGVDLKEFRGVGAELGEEVFRLVVLILAAKPSDGHHMGHARNGSNPLTVKLRQKVRQRNPVTGHQPLRRILTALIEVKTPPNRHHQRQQEQGERNASYGQQAAALVAKCVFGDEMGQGHGSCLGDISGTYPDVSLDVPTKCTQNLGKRFASDFRNSDAPLSAGIIL